jgi:hypothetical protein
MAEPLADVPANESVTVPLLEVDPEIVGAAGIVNGVPFDDEDEELGPTAFTARRRTPYVTPFVKEPIVKLLPVISPRGTVTQVAEPSRLYS